MFRLLISLFCVALAVLQGVDAASIANYQVNLRQGTCRGENLVNEDIFRPAAEYTTKKLTYTWRGDNFYYITCINVYNKESTLHPTSVRIVDGGVGNSRVNLEFISKNGHEINTHLDIYGSRIP